MLEQGFIKISRKLAFWRWYRDANTFRVFFHLLLTANYEDCDFECITVRRGQRITSRKMLAAELGLSEQNVRTALQHLESTGEITSTITPKFTVVTIKNYDEFQSVTGISTSDQPAAHQQVTSDQPQCKKDKERKRKQEEGQSPRHKYGAFRHVLLTEEQHRGLVTEFGEVTAQDYIRRLDEYLEQTGRRYKNHDLTIRKWLAKDGMTAKEDAHEKYAGTAAGKGFV